MKMATIGTTEIETSSIVLGTWAIGGWAWGGAEEADSIAAIQTALDKGINFIDTAPIYGRGYSEEVVGKAIEGRRDDVVVATKVGLRWDLEEGEFNFESDDGFKIYKNLKDSSIRHEVERSLKLLKTDYIDLLQTHWQDTTTPIADTMATLLDLKKEGKIRAIGVCNVTEDQLAEYQACGQIDSIQEMYSMIDRDHETGLFPRALSDGMSVLAYSPLAMGLLTGKIGPERVFPASDQRSWSPRFTVEWRQKVADMLKQFEPIAAKYGVTIAQLVIMWTVAQDCVTHVLCGVRNPDQARENATAGQVLDTVDKAAMDEIIETAALKVPHPFLGD